MCRSTGEVDATYKDSGLTHTVLSAVVESNLMGLPVVMGHLCISTIC